MQTVPLATLVGQWLTRLEALDDTPGRGRLLQIAQSKPSICLVLTELFNRLPKMNGFAASATGIDASRAIFSWAAFRPVSRSVFILSDTRETV